MPPGGLWRRFCADQRGNMAMLFSATSVLGLVCCALAVDEASLYLDRRQSQSATDLAALTAVRNPANGFAIARQVLIDAGVLDAALPVAQLRAAEGPVRLAVTVGAYRNEAGLRPGQRFVAGGIPANAVRVVFIRPGQLHFAASWMHAPAIGVAATASADPVVSFSVGSRLLALREGLANAVLNRLLGAQVTLSAASYSALLDARVSLPVFLDALAHELGVTAGRYDDLLEMRADHGQIAAALARSLSGADRTAALVLARALGGNGRVEIGKLFGLGPLGRLAIGSGGALTQTRLSALDILAASLGLSDGTHQVALGLTAGVPGLTRLSATLTVGEPAQGATWFAIGPAGTVVRTAQVRLAFIAEIGGGATMLGATVRVPLTLELASAEARVQSATCPASGAEHGSAVIATRPAVARLVLGDRRAGTGDDFGRPLVFDPALMVDLDLLLSKLRVTGAAEAEIANPAATALAFSSVDIANGTVRTARTSIYLTGLTATLMQRLTLTVSVAGLSLPTAPVIRATIALLVAPLAPVIDATMDAVLTALGIRLGEADVRVYAVTCTSPRLVG